MQPSEMKHERYCKTHLSLYSLRGIEREGAIKYKTKEKGKISLQFNFIIVKIWSFTCLNIEVLLTVLKIKSLILKRKIKKNSKLNIEANNHTCGFKTVLVDFDKLESSYVTFRDIQNFTEG